jgi:threonine-phosphate decarboxylase
MLLGHGGNIEKAASSYKIPKEGLIDFSSNINPLGIPAPSRALIKKAAESIGRYPDPECVSVKAALSEYLGVPGDNIIVANGSNELIHLIPRALGIKRGLVYHPAFSEYELGLRLSGAKITFLLAREPDSFRIDIKKVIEHLSKVSLVILCNPNNPTGYLLKKDELLELAGECGRRKKYLLMDEVFMEFVEGHKSLSLVKEAGRNRYILALRSLTKFFGMPGLRIGYLVAAGELVRKMELLQPTWSVNSIAQAAAAVALSDKNFISQSGGYIAKERRLLFEGLKTINGIRPYEPSANFILCRIINKKFNADSLSRRLLRRGILIRDCANFKGLDSSFFRVAVKKRKENIRLIDCLKEVFG